MLKAGDALPHFAAATLDGRSFRYGDIWQRKNLVLIVLPLGDSSASRERLADWRAAAIRTSGDDTEWVVTSDEVPGVGRPGIVVADKWGETQFVQSSPSVADLPVGDELAEWIQFVRHQCPECQGEAK